MDVLYDRSARTKIVEALGDTRVVFVMGARQVGKSTLTSLVAERDHPARTITLDERAARAAALNDPDGFIADLDGPVVIDEVLRAPDLLLAIKAAVDRDPTPGRFLLTGSANVLTNRMVSDALTGRIEIVRLWPLSQSEIQGSSANLIDVLFAGRPPRIDDAPAGRGAFVEIVAAGGFPEALRRRGRRRQAWFDDYLRTTLDRDLRDISDALRLDAMPRLLRLLASQATGILNHAAVANRLGLHPDTVRSYVQLLETVFLVQRLPAWRPGLGPREVHAPKLYLVDSGLLAHLLAADERRIAGDDQMTGRLLENFVAMEIVKHADWARPGVRVHHYRDGRDEVDLVLESRAGEIVAIEVKATTSLDARGWRGLAKLRDRAGERFRAGAVVHAGRQTLPLGDRLWAVPISALWA